MKSILAFKQLISRLQKIVYSGVHDFFKNFTEYRSQGNWSVVGIQ